MAFIFIFYLFDTLFQECDTHVISYKVFLLAALIITPTTTKEIVNYIMTTTDF